VILPYVSGPAECLEWDALAPEAARVVIGLLKPLRAEHVGSSAVPGCAGKGVLDLLILYPPGGLEQAKAVLDELGFQRQGGRDPWPEERPMRVGTMEYAGRQFRIHAHVVAEDSPEVAQLIWFRDRLRRDPEFLRSYVAQKREILASGTTDPVEYSMEKGKRVDFVGDVRSIVERLMEKDRS